MASNYINVIWSARATRKPANVIQMATPKLVPGEDPILIAFRAQQELAATLDARVAESESSRSEIIREALRQYLDMPEVLALSLIHI